MVELHDIDCDAFSDVLEYLYSGELKVTTNNVVRIAKLADMFELSSLHEFCCKFLTKRMSTENCIGFMKFGRVLNSIKLEMAACEFSLDHFDDVIQSEEFMEMTASDLCLYLKQPTLRASCEEDVFNAALRWLEYDTDNRINDFKDVLCSIHLLDIDLSVMRFGLMKIEALQNNKALHQLVDQIQDHVLYKFLAPGDLQVLPPRLHTRLRKGVMFFLKKSINKTKVSDSISVFIDHQDEIGLKHRDVSSLHHRAAFMYNLGVACCTVAPSTVYMTGVSPHMDEIWRLDMHNKQWQFCVKMTRGLCYHRVVSGCHNKMYVIGGIFSAKPQPSLDMSQEIVEFDCQANTLRRVGSLKTPVFRFGAVFVKGDILIVGGMRVVSDRTFKTEPVTGCQKFDTFTKQCTQLDVTLPIKSRVVQVFMPQSQLIIITEESIISVDAERLLNGKVDESDCKVVSHTLGKDFTGNILGKRIVVLTRAGTICTTKWQTLFDNDVARFDVMGDADIASRFMSCADPVAVANAHKDADD